MFFSPERMLSRARAQPHTRTQTFENAGVDVGAGVFWWRKNFSPTFFFV